MRILIAYAAAAMLALPARVSSAEAPLFDSQIVGVLEAADQAAIANANAVVARSRDQDVIALATLLLDDHLAATGRLGNVGIASTGSDDRARLEERLKADMRRVEALGGGAALDRAYVDVVLGGNAALLDLLDAKLIPAAKDPGLAAHLGERRYVIEIHLARARRLKSRL